MSVDQPPQSAIDAAIEAAKRSGCRKSQRGVAIFELVDPFTPACLVSPTISGNNHPPRGFVCDGSPVCREHCNRLCIHAEADALESHAHNGDPYSAHDLLHVKVVDGEAVPSGPPSCWQCSRQIVEAGICGVWLLHDTGWRRYSTDEFHEATLRHHGLPVIRKGGAMPKTMKSTADERAGLRTCCETGAWPNLYEVARVVRALLDDLDMLTTDPKTEG